MECFGGTKTNAVIFFKSRETRGLVGLDDPVLHFSLVEKKEARVGVFFE